MNKLDKNEAPVGYEAMEIIRFSGCGLCVFADNGDCMCADNICFPCERVDGQSVYFVKKEQQPSEAE